jgi:DNA-binding transcriptional MerR regulator
MLRIGDFASLTGVTIETLRHYDRIDLFKPSFTDPATNHRFYTLEQLPSMYRILALKRLGLSLAEIEHLLQKPLSDEEIRGMLRLREAELAAAIDEQQQQLTELRSWMKAIESQQFPATYNVVVRPIEARRVALLPITRQQGPTMLAVFRHLQGQLEERGVKRGNPLTVYDLSTRQAGKAEDSRFLFKLSDGGDLYYRDIPTIQRYAAFVLESPLAPDESHPFELMTLPEDPQVATVIHQGSVPDGLAATLALAAWIQANGYLVLTRVYEVFRRFVEHKHHPDNMVELQFPIRAGRAE